MIRETSLLAYDELKYTGRLSAQERRIMRALHMGGDRDWSLQEIVQLTGIPINCVAGRVNGLKKMLYLEECDKRACSITGRTITPVRVTR